MYLRNLKTMFVILVALLCLVYAAQNIANLDVEAVITGNVGPNAFKTLNAAGIKIFLANKQTVSQAIESYKAGQLKEVDQANVQGYWV